MANIILTGTDLSVGENGSTTTFTIALDENPTSGVVVVTIGSDDTGEATVANATVVFNSTNGTTPQTITLTGADDTEVDGDQISTITATVIHSDDNNFESLTETITVTTTDDEAAGFDLSQATVSVGEDGTEASFTVSLTGQPTSDVVFNISSTDTDGDEVTVSDETLTFTSANWFTPQTVTLTGVNDGVIDGDQSNTITISVADGSDAAFVGLAAQEVEVTTTDIDAAGFSLDQTSVTVSEDGTTTTETLTITLDAEPASSVTFNITPTDGTEVSVSQNQVTIDPENWDTGATVTLIGAPDDVVDGDQTTDVTVSVDASSDDAFDGLDDQTVTVTTTDDEVAGFSLSKTSAVVGEAGGTDTITITLDDKPVSDVVLKITVEDPNEVSVSESTVTLTPDNWDQGVDVTLSGIEDLLIDGDQSTTVSVSVDAPNSDDAFDNLPAQDITVNTIDSMECFLTGTHILTDRGEVPVEALNIGDRVLTADGTYEEIKWVGRQTIEPSRIKYPLRGYPILIKAGALGHNLPHRDLYVSPDHAMLVEGLLINAWALVNGRSILHTEPTETFTYYHVELNQHSLLVVEGTAAESYLPQKEDRSWYDNGDEYAALYPHNSILAYWPMKYARVSSKRQLPRFVSKQLEKRANGLYDIYAVAG